MTGPVTSATESATPHGSTDLQITPVILSGGTGTRLWPVSRAGMAKQLLPLTGVRTLLQMTLARVVGHAGFAAPMVIGGHAVRFVIRDQVLQVAPEAMIVLEPERRDTLAAVLLAAVIARNEDPGRMLAILPSDHLIRDEAEFRRAVHSAAAGVAAGGVAVIGVAPAGPDAAYGYIEPGAPFGTGVLSVVRFVEKPDPVRAAELIARGCLWNAGLFVFRADWLVAALDALYPEDVARMCDAVARMRPDLGMFIPGSAFGSVRAISFDHGYMERTDAAVVARANFSWADVGDWNALWIAEGKDTDGNALKGDVVAVAVKNSLIRAESRTVCAIGVEDLAIVETPDAVLVAPRARAQEVKDLVANMARQNRPVASEHIRTHRPWGWFQTTDHGERFRVKRILVNPGAKLSLQRHLHRSEHWVVVRGAAEVTLDGAVTVLHENESVHIPIGAVHRLANPGRIAAEIIEVQTGTYLEDDDIERMADDFGRA